MSKSLYDASGCNYNKSFDSDTGVTMSDTPRTDVEEYHTDAELVVSADFARELERQLNQCIEALDDTYNKLRELDSDFKINIERVGLADTMIKMKQTLQQVKG
jgi:hypothetical protein